MCLWLVKFQYNGFISVDLYPVLYAGTMVFNENFHISEVHVFLAYTILLNHLTSNCISLAMSSWILWALSSSVAPSRLQRAMMASISERYLQQHRKSWSLTGLWRVASLLTQTSCSGHFFWIYWFFSDFDLNKIIHILLKTFFLPFFEIWGFRAKKKWSH